MTPEEKRAYYKEWYGKNAERCREKSRKWAEANPDKIKARQIEKGSEYQRRYRQNNPEKARQAYRTWASKNKEKLAELHKRYARNLRAEMLEVYGGECVCCHEDRPDFLTIDHIETASDMKKRGVDPGPRDGGRMPQWLKKQEWPKEGYRLMCWNCNCGRRRTGECPHEIERRRAALKVVFE